MVARLEGKRDISCILKRLEGLAYSVMTDNKMVAFIYRKGANSNNLRGDIRTIKEACRFNGSLRVIYGNNDVFI